MIDVTATRREPSGHWKKHIPGAPDEVEFLPLVDGDASQNNGWCTYEGHLEDAPDVEVICGGKNSKLPAAAAIWRQANLLHFGFQESPTELNATGRDLLENCVVYATKFANNRPLGHVKSVFVAQQRPELRKYVPVVIDSEHATSAAIAQRFFSGALRDRLAAMPLDAVRAWARDHLDWFYAGEDGKLAVDEELRKVGVRADSPRFFDAALAAIDSGHAAEAALGALQRYVPSGPGAANAQAWREYLAAQRDYLFYSEGSGYVWLLDTLAQQRGVPSRELRGAARAAVSSR